MSEIIRNVLADRYASPAMKAIWSEEGKVRLEREFWVAVLKAQKDLGLDIPLEAIAAYEAQISNVDLESIRRREKTLRHDVKSRIEEFSALAGFEHIHKGLTSRDLTDNVEQYQILKSLKVIRIKAGAALNRLSERASEFRNLVITARTHNVAAQPTTLGKRFAMFGEDLLQAFKLLDRIIDGYPLRGVKGAVGTLLDIKTLFKNDSEKVRELEKRIAQYMGFKEFLNATGQVYPRSLDFEVISALYALSSGPSSFCKTLRIMAGNETASEGFQKGQVGSSAMPHKMNSRNCERVNGFAVILGGYLEMASRLAGDQWNEGDVSCSVVRRVALPDAFYAMDGLLETFLTILGEMKVFEEVVNSETSRYLPFLLSTTLLMEAVKAGAGREQAHAVIKKHSHEVINALRQGKQVHNDLIIRLTQDEEFPLEEKELKAILSDTSIYLGEAPVQVDEFVKTVKELLVSVPEAKDYKPGQIL